MAMMFAKKPRSGSTNEEILAMLRRGVVSPVDGADLLGMAPPPAIGFPGPVPPAGLETAGATIPTSSPGGGLNASMQAPPSLPDPTMPGSQGANRLLDTQFPEGETANLGSYPKGMFGRSAKDMIADRQSFLPDAKLYAPLKPGWNDVGGMGDRLSTLAADLMMAGGNQAGAASIMQNIHQRQRDAQQRAWGQEDYQRSRTDAQADDERDFRQQMALEGYKRQVPADEFSRYLAQGGFSPEEQQRLYRQRAESMANPTQWITAENGDGTKTVMPMPRYAPARPGTQAPPAMAVAALKANPALATQFDDKYGYGAAARALGKGGAGLATPSTFP